jgi:hypothetical protein
MLSFWSGSIVGSDCLPNVTGSGVFFLEFGDRLGKTGVERISLLVTEERFVGKNVLQVILKEAVALVDPLLLAVTPKFAGGVSFVAICRRSALLFFAPAHPNRSRISG